MVQIGNFSATTAKEAKECFIKVLDREPDHRTASTGLAKVFTQCGELDEAETIYQHLKSSDPLPARFDRDFVAFLVASERFTEAASEMEQAMQKCPNDTALNVMYGKLLVDNLRREDQGISYLLQALETDPSNEQAFSKLSALSSSGTARFELLFCKRLECSI